MPIYQYICDACGFSFDIMQKITDPPLEKCRKCSSALRKQITPPVIVFKGTGWYVTDYGQKSKKENVGGEKVSDSAKSTNKEKAGQEKSNAETANASKTI